MTVAAGDIWKRFDTWASTSAQLGIISSTTSIFRTGIVEWVLVCNLDLFFVTHVAYLGQIDRR